MEGSQRVGLQSHKTRHTCRAQSEFRGWSPALVSVPLWFSAAYTRNQHYKRNHNNEFHFSLSLFSDSRFLCTFTSDAGKSQEPSATLNKLLAIPLYRSGSKSISWRQKKPGWH